jgi:hypothetical protein
MIHARIQHGCIEPQEPIPADWEGQFVTVSPLAPDAAPDDSAADLEDRLAELHSLGPMEFELGEERAIADALAELNEASRAAMVALAVTQR